MGLDQHRAQITAEWLDTATGELSRKRIAPADRARVRAFAAQFRDQELEDDLTLGWIGVPGGDREPGSRVEGRFDHHGEDTAAIGATNQEPAFAPRRVRAGGIVGRDVSVHY